MGLCASQARLLLLYARKSDLEFQMQRITQRRMMLSEQIMANMNPNGTGAGNNMFSGLSNCGTSQQSGNNGFWTSALSTLGSSVGSAFGPVWGTLGGFAGKLLGGLFGGNQQSNGSSGIPGTGTSVNGYVDENYLAALQQMDKTLEMQGKQIDTQHQAIQTECESVKKVIDKNIEMSFKYFA